MTVTLAEVTFRYPGASEPALNAISLDVPSRGITLVTGRLGSGCSTLLLVMGGLVPHVTGGALVGTVRALDVDATSKKARPRLAGRVGLLLPTPWTQLSGMSFSVREEIAFGPANLGWRRERIADSVEYALALFDVAHLAARDPQTLSGGELQRVMFAAVVVMEPEILLLDEPLQELDGSSAERIVQEVLPGLAARSSVVVAATDVDAVAEIVDRVVVLDRGRCVITGTRDVLASAHAVAQGTSTAVARIASLAGLPPPHPLFVSQLRRRIMP